MLKEFKEFAMRGNVLDMAIGVIIGAAFGKIITSLVNDIIMPPIGKLTGGMDFANLFLVLGSGTFKTIKEAQAAGVATINYGMFINTVLDFIIVAFVVFLVVKQVNRLKKAPPAEAPTTKECPFCISQVPLKATKCPNCTSELPSQA